MKVFKLFIYSLKDSMFIPTITPATKYENQKAGFMNGRKKLILGPPKSKGEYVYNASRAILPMRENVSILRQLCLQRYIMAGERV